MRPTITIRHRVTFLLVLGLVLVLTGAGCFTEGTVSNTERSDRRQGEGAGKTDLSDDGANLNQPNTPGRDLPVGWKWHLGKTIQIALPGSWYSNEHPRQQGAVTSGMEIDFDERQSFPIGVERFHPILLSVYPSTSLTGAATLAGVVPKVTAPFLVGNVSYSVFSYVSEISEEKHRFYTALFGDNVVELDTVEVYDDVARQMLGTLTLSAQGQY